MLTFQLPTREDTLSVGRTLGSLLEAGDVIALIGDLGAGKTTLTQAIAAGMGIQDPVTSPTFTLVQEYGDDFPLFHFDPYRLESPEDMCDFGFSEYFEQGGVVVIEWADKIQALLPDDHLALTLIDPDIAGATEDADEAPGEEIEVSESGIRYLRIDAGGERSAQLLDRLAEIPAVQALQIPPESMPARPMPAARPAISPPLKRRPGATRSPIVNE